MLAHAVAGDRVAQGEILRANHQYIRRLLHRLVGPTSELDDLQQTVLMRVVTGLPRLREEESLKTWIGGICVHVARDHIRRRQVRSVVGSLEADEPGRARTTAGNPVEQLEAREGLVRCRRALEELSASHRVALTLRIMGHSVDEIATMMGSARSTARLRLYYARKAFCRAFGADPGDAAALLSDGVENT
ncbi:MAG: sigma-70 family RNA polymerase sigma factor [Deltaproteobacteria bacterium]|nr:sigma-70 family RNA polymerase sigma factor [Deltaproteobacteria bacterium]